MSVIEELRQNDPARTRISIGLCDQRSDADLAQALQQNPFVKAIELNVDGEERANDWVSLLRVIATRANLKKVKLRDGHADSDFERLFVGAPAALVRAILRAMQQNTAIRSVDLQCVCLPIDTISTFVDIASSITSFSINGCYMEPANRQQGARSLAAALQRNTNIKHLKLSEMEDIYAIPMLEGLRFNSAVKSFAINIPPWKTFVAIQQLLESTTSIQKFGLGNASFRENQFCPIAQAITSSECLSKLKFRQCSFKDQSSIVQLRSILQNKRNLMSLCLDSCDFDGGHVHEAIISTFLRPDSSLRCFIFRSRNSLESVFPRIQFENLLQAIQKSKLERFLIGSILTLPQLQTLTASIPLMKLKELEVDFWEFDEETIMRDLLHAVKNNFSLRSVKAKLLGRDPDNADKQTLAFYANRNKLLDQWVGNPETVEQKLWPEALSLSQRAGPNSLFRGLRSVLESDYVHLPAGRKRKARSIKPA